MKVLSNADVLTLATITARNIRQDLQVESVRAFPIPRGGIPAAYAIKGIFPGLIIVDDPAQADIFVDDIIDSGKTRQDWCARFDKPFYALLDKTKKEAIVDEHNAWIVFPWEATEQGSAEDIVTRMIQFIGDDPTRQGLIETPKRVIKAWREWFDGYTIDIKDVFKVFEDGAENVDEMVIVRDIPVESFCEHHMARFHGVAHVGYIPSGKIVGLSKIGRLVRAYSHRLQVQERLTNQIADAMSEHLNPLGVGVVIECAHTCMSSRGAKIHGSSTVTSAMRGRLREDVAARAEFMSLIKSK